MKRWIQNAKKLVGRNDGNVMIEFAIGSAILVAAFAGTFQFGYTFLQYNELENAVTRSARYASLINYDSASDVPANDFQTAVQNMALYGTPTAGTTPVLPGLTAANVNVTVCGITIVCPGYTSPLGVPQEVTVSITGYTIDAVFEKVTLNEKPQVTFSYLGIWTPL
jgi:Flp pilus assembly protein TadG